MEKQMVLVCRFPHHVVLFSIMQLNENRDVAFVAGLFGKIERTAFLLRLLRGGGTT